MDIYINNVLGRIIVTASYPNYLKSFHLFGYLKRFKSERQSVINIKQVYA